MAVHSLCAKLESTGFMANQNITNPAVVVSNGVTRCLRLPCGEVSEMSYKLFRAGIGRNLSKVVAFRKGFFFSHNPLSHLSKMIPA